MIKNVVHIGWVRCQIAADNLPPVINPADIGKDHVQERHFDRGKVSIFQQKTMWEVIAIAIDAYDLAMIINVQRKGRAGTGNIKGTENSIVIEKSVKVTV